MADYDDTDDHHDDEKLIKKVSSKYQKREIQKNILPKI